MIALALTALAPTQAMPIETDPQETIIRLAFDPARLFDRAGHPLVGIQYLGDDYGYPVYAIALAHGCTGKRGPDCRPTLIARMVRAPNASKVERPRWAGAAVVNRVKQAGATTPEEIASALDRLDLEWREVDLSACPAAMAVLPDAAKAEWMPPAMANPLQRQPLEMFLHFDTVSVTLSGDYTRKTNYSGRIADHLPSGWAVRLAAALEPCWRPATAAPPWRRAFTPPPRAAPASPPPP